MTPNQNRAIGVLSAIATIVVLVAGGSGSSLDAKVAAALAKQRTHDVAGPAGAVASDSADSTADDVGTIDGGGDGGAVAAADATGGDGAADEGADSGGGTPGPTDVEAKPTKIEHVFTIALAGHGFEANFGAASAAPYLNGELVPKGALLTEYRSLASTDLPDYLAMVGGQPPNADTLAGCPTYKEIPFTATPTKSGEITDAGCVYPNTVTTVGDQLSASRREWRGYIEDLEKGPDGKATCRRPASNAVDDTVKARPGDGYATRHNPFVYFHSLLDLGDCDATDGPLERLETDLQKVETTPNYAFVTPNLCNDGSESPCADGSPGGLAAADAFLAKWVPKIIASPAYRENGLLIVTFAGGPADPAGGGGVRNGTLLLSPFADAGTKVAAPYDPYSLLRSVQDLFALKPLARANDASSFADTVLARAFVTPPSDD